MQQTGVAGDREPQLRASVNANFELVDGGAALTEPNAQRRKVGSLVDLVLDAQHGAGARLREADQARLGRNVEQRRIARLAPVEVLAR
jgi:hypothetical protein